MECRNKNEIKLRSLLMYIDSLKTINKDDSIWRKRAFSFLNKFYQSYKEFPKELQKQELSKIMTLDSLILLASTKKYIQLSDYLWGLPGFDFSEKNQHFSAYENHGFLTLQFSQVILNWNLKYINESLDYERFLKVGFDEFLNENKNFSKLTNSSFVFFKNAFIDFNYEIICFDNSEDENQFIQYLKIDKKVISKHRNFILKQKILYKGEVFYYSNDKKFIKLFDDLIKFIDIDIIVNLFEDKDSILSFTDDLETIKEFIYLNYKI